MKKFRLATFDLDNTLAKLGKGILPGNIELLKKLEMSGVRIAICSGKPVYYLCGFMRQAGLADPILVGENGAVIQFGVDLPPEYFYVLPYSDNAKNVIELLEKKIKDRFPNLYFQPNEVGLTPFPRSEEEFLQIQQIFDDAEKWMQEVIVYRHVDSFDVVPVGIDKYSGMKFLGELLKIGPEETVAIGDGVNDYPMFEYSGYSIGINVADVSKVDINFEDISAALCYLLKE